MLRVSGGRRASACALLVVLALAGCGQEDGTAQESPTADASSSESSSSTPDPEQGEQKKDKAEKVEKAPPGTPDCGDVWKAGGEIPRFYQGCTDQAGAYVKRDALACSSGQRVVRYGNRFWGVMGGTINEANGSLDDDRDYKVSMRNCSA